MEHAQGLGASAHTHSCHPQPLCLSCWLPVPWDPPALPHSILAPWPLTLSPPGAVTKWCWPEKTCIPPSSFVPSRGCPSLSTEGGAQAHGGSCPCSLPGAGSTTCVWWVTCQGQSSHPDSGNRYSLDLELSVMTVYEILTYRQIR